MASRLERAIAAAMELYQAEPPAVRKQIEEALIVFREVLLAGDAVISAATKTAFQSATEQAIAEGLIGGQWGKVRAALQAAAPALYEQLKEIIPGGGGHNPLSF